MRTLGTCGQRGFTYLWLIFLLAIGAATLAAAGQRWSGVTQRERERETIFRGRQIATAIASYRGAPGVAAQWPRSLDELTEDRRGPVMQRHLRRVYDDPFTGAPDWVPILADDGGWRGLYSRSHAPALIAPDTPLPADALRRARVSDHRFLAGESTRVGPASAPSAASAALFEPSVAPTDADAAMPR